MLDSHSQETTKYQATTTVPITNRMATLVATDHISKATMGFALFLLHQESQTPYYTQIVGSLMILSIVLRGPVGKNRFSISGVAGLT